MTKPRRLRRPFLNGHDIPKPPDVTCMPVIEPTPELAALIAEAVLDERSRRIGPPPPLPPVAPSGGRYGS